MLPVDDVVSDSCDSLLKYCKQGNTNSSTKFIYGARTMIAGEVTPFKSEAVPSGTWVRSSCKQTHITSTVYNKYYHNNYYQYDVAYRCVSI